jgi:DNA-directed RNA polymerase subunit RPC12/RpoP
MSHPINRTYFCEDCVFTFTIHSKMNRGLRPHCPKCGDNIQVTHYQKKEPKPRQFWDEEEMNLIDRIVKGELQIYQVAVKLGRSHKSVSRRVQRRREEVT